LTGTTKPLSIQLKGTTCRSLALPALPRQLQAQAISSDAGSVADVNAFVTFRAF
jgi:hypothetical protein